MKSILISINPKWCEKIARGEKTIEVRKTRPKLEPPFKCYIYCTRGSPYLNRHNGRLYLETKDILGGNGNGLYERLSGRVIGEFVCDWTKRFDVPYPAFQKKLDKRILEDSCLTYYQLHRYAYHDALYSWHISDLCIYDTSKALTEFHAPCTPACNFSGECGGVQDGEHCQFPLKRPPQSWCYVDQ